MAEQEFTTNPTQSASTSTNKRDDHTSITEQAAQQAKTMAAKAKEGAQEGVNQIANEATKATRELGDEVKGIAADAAQQAESHVNEQKVYAADRLAGVATALRETGNSFRTQEEASFAHYADNAADQVERFSGYLRDQNVNALVHDVKEMAKRQPELFVAGALAAGFFLGRFFKSTDAETMPTQYRGGYPGQYTQPGAAQGYRPTYGQPAYSSQSYSDQSYNNQPYSDQRQNNPYKDEAYRTEGGADSYSGRDNVSGSTSHSTATSTGNSAYSTNSDNGAKQKSTQETTSTDKTKATGSQETHAYATASTITDKQKSDKQTDDSTAEAQKNHGSARKEQ